MKYLLIIFPIFALMLVCTAFSQNKPCAVQSWGDSIHQCAAAHQGMTKGALMCRWHGMGALKGCMLPFHHQFRRHMMFHRGLFFAFLLVMALVNILLTVLVCVDMAALGRFNALWVPVLLLFGIAGTALYALFRIGDQIKEAGKPRG